jgi:hypothetical protein
MLTSRRRISRYHHQLVLCLIAAIIKNPKGKFNLLFAFNGLGSIVIREFLKNGCCYNRPRALYWSAFYIYSRYGRTSAAIP